VKFSTIAQWRVGDIGYLSRPPPKEEMQPANRQMWEIQPNNEENENLAVQQFIEAIAHIDEDIANVENVANIENIENIQFIVDRQLIDQQLDEDEEYVDDEDVIEQYIFMSQFE
jgi:hypothetical protein